MRFHDITIRNYKGYRDSARLELKPGINVIVGKNNAGKTALLEALSMRSPANPHRSLVTKPRPSSELQAISISDLTLTVTKDEVIDLLICARRDREFHLVLPSNTDPIWSALGFEQYDDTMANRFGEWFFAHDSFTFRLRREAYGGGEEGNWDVGEDSYVSPRFARASENEGTTSYYCKFTIDSYERGFNFLGKVNVSGGRHSDDFILSIARFLKRYAYRFEAERLPSLPCPLGIDRTLAANAGNLAEVLHLMQGNHDQFGVYNRLVREVLPDVQQVGVRKLRDNQGEVVIWNDQSASARNDLAFSLQESGAGVGHVLAMLYVVLTADEPQMILIDEPQGFLHPGAARKLIEVLRYHAKSKHQIVIATHSPTVISSADPSTITLVKQEGTESVFETVDVTETKQQQRYLLEIGARLSDVFGFERVLWVEGNTEELCFPMILKELTSQLLLGTAIIRVQQTGDFNRKDAKNVIAIYERLSQLKGGLVPPVVGFVFDREDRSRKDLEDLTRQSRGRIRVTGKRLYENYLLNPEGIASVINETQGRGRRRITTTRVRKLIAIKRSEGKYFRPFKAPAKDDESWSNNIHGALLLADLFNELSGGLVQFDKTDHSVKLTEWVIKNAPEDLGELLQLLLEVLNESADMNGDADPV